MAERDTCFLGILAAVLLIGGVLASSKMAVIRGWFGMGKPPAIQLVVLPFATPDADSSAKHFPTVSRRRSLPSSPTLLETTPCKLSPRVKCVPALSPR